MRLANGFEVLYDPDQLFAGNRFGRRDFIVSLKGWVWANGMVVKDMKDQLCYVVEGEELVETPDRDWIRFRREKLNA